MSACCTAHPHLCSGGILLFRGAKAARIRYRQGCFESVLGVSFREKRIVKIND